MPDKEYDYEYDYEYEERNRGAVSMREARVHVIIHGFVQGVFFRYSTRERAAALRLKGWVKNNFNGTVEAVFEGSKGDVETIINWCRRGPSGSRVDRVDLSWDEPTGEFDSFKIKGW